MSKLSNKPWGSVDKDELLKYVIDHPDKAKDIYMKIGKNWQEDPYNRLSYPIADKNGTVYRYGLSSALAYAKANNETEVVSKVKKLYKEYGISEEKCMRKIIEAVVDEAKVDIQKVQDIIDKCDPKDTGSKSAYNKCVRQMKSDLGYSESEARNILSDVFCWDVE